MISLIKLFIIFSLSFISANSIPPNCDNECNLLVKLVIDSVDKKMIEYIQDNICKRPVPKSINEKKIFCANLAFAGDFFNIPIHFDKLPGRLCGSVKILKTDTSKIVELPNLISFPGCNCA
jgi:hypothetical protein